jgi:hypothetical protein
MLDVKQYDPRIDGAIFDSTGQYRHMLWRTGQRPAVWICLNPSMASAIRSDNSFDSMLRISRYHGFDTAVVVNLHDFVETDSEKLKDVEHPVSPWNAHYILKAAALAPYVICAWGNKGSMFGQDKVVRDLLISANVEAKCLRLSKQCQPEHPLYKPANSPLWDYHLSFSHAANAVDGPAMRGFQGIRKFEVPNV